MGRVLAVDPGTKRTGLALSDELGITAQGLDTFEASKDKSAVDRIEELVREHGVSVVVIGMPISMSGGDIEGTDRSRALAGEIKARCGVETVLLDERMTSLEAERVLRQEGRIKKPGDIDRLSAVLLLQGYLERQSG